MGVLKGAKPRKEVLHGDLEDAIFAAEFGKLISGNAPKVYADAKTFFQNTHPAQQLRKVAEVLMVAPTLAGRSTIRARLEF